MHNVDLRLSFLPPDSICWSEPELAWASFKMYFFPVSTQKFLRYSFLQEEEHVEALTSAVRTPSVFSLPPFHPKNILSYFYRNSNISKQVQNIYKSDPA